MKFKTCKRYNDPGHAHLLTFTCFRNQSFLIYDWICEYLAESINNMKSKYNVSVWAYVFMPDHVHLLIYPKDETYDISSILFGIKKPFSQRVFAACKKKNPQLLSKMIDMDANGNVKKRFWQSGGGYDRNYFNLKEIVKVIDYIHDNPIRKGLIDRAEDWEYSSANEYAGMGEGIIKIDKESLLEVMG